MNALTVWDNLPYPGVSPESKPQPLRIVVDWRVWEHVVDRHVLPGREPWGDVLSGGVVEAIHRAAGREAAGSGEPAATVLRRLEGEVRATLERPMVLQYEVTGSPKPGAFRSERWLLLLPCGALVAIGRARRSFFVATCYFPRAAVVEPRAERRWQRVAVQLVLRYGTIGGSPATLSPPVPQVTFPVPRREPAREWRSNVRFVTPESWGFCPDLTGCPWRGRLGPWPAASAGVETKPTDQARRRRLKPPRRLWEEEKDNG